MAIDSTASSLSIRPSGEADRDALYEICLKTADSGKDGTELFSDPRLPGYVWALPYAELEPRFSFVLANEHRAIGYVIAAADTAAFSRRLETDWWPWVRKQVAGMQPTKALDALALGKIATPDSHPAWLAADYPAHLHINVLPEAQSGGWGRRLIETELAALRAAGVRGVHLGVSPTNEPAKGFYRHIGFDDISRDGRVLFGMILNP